MPCVPPPSSLTRRAAVGTLLAAAGAPALVLAQAATPVPAPSLPAVVVQTLVWAGPGRRDPLRRFLQANWVAMDTIAIARGLFTHAILHELAGDASSGTGRPYGEPVDFVMEVGYRTTGGYADVADAFEAIRAAHTTVLVDGSDFRALGRVVGQLELRPVVAG